MSCGIDCIPWTDRIDDAEIYIDSLPCIENYSVDVRELAYKYYAAHLVFLTNPTVYIEKIKFVNDERTYKLPELGSGYMGSPYGQFVNEILGGCLEKNKKSKTSFTFSGTSF